MVIFAGRYQSNNIYLGYFLARDNNFGMLVCFKKSTWNTKKRVWKTNKAVI